MMRLLSLNYEFPPIGGGGGNAHQHILKEFVNIPGLSVDLITITNTNQSAPYVESYSDNVRIHYLPIKKRDMHYWRRGEIIRYLVSHHRFLRKHLAEHDYDLCHVFFGFPSGLLAYLQRHKVPYIVSVRGSDVPGYNARFSWDYAILRPALNRIYRNAKLVVANSQSFRGLFERQFPGLSADVVPNGIDLEAFAPSRDKKSGRINIVSVARLIPRKGIDLLIGGCKALRDGGIDFQCHIIGEGPEKPRLKEQAARLGIAEAIVFHGAMAREPLAKFLPACDIFALPSHAEGMSNAALEALACGLPLALTDTGGTSELIDGNGVIVPTGNAAALGGALLALCNDDALREQMGRQSREHAQNFTWENAARRYYSIYQNALGRTES